MRKKKPAKRVGRARPRARQPAPARRPRPKHETVARSEPSKQPKAGERTTLLDVAPAKLGRRPKLTPQLMDDFEFILQAPVFIEDACDALGVAQSSFYAWMDRGRKEAARLDAGEEASPDEAPFMEFSERMRVVSGRTAVKHVTLLASDASKHWKANVELLRRRWPSKWNRLKVDLTDDKGIPPAENIEAWLRGQDGEDEV